jgi:hypothetical protein
LLCPPKRAQLPSNNVLGRNTVDAGLTLMVGETSDLEARQFVCEKYCIYTTPRGNGLFGDAKGRYLKNCDYDEKLASPRLQHGLCKAGLNNSACDCNGYRLKKDGVPDNSTSWAVYKPTCDHITHSVSK